MDLDDRFLATPLKAESFIALDSALKRLEAIAPRQSRVVELKFFAGLGFEEIASILDLNSRTVKRDWHSAKAWLHGVMTGEE